jgi:hypothetical protein
MEVTGKPHDSVTKTGNNSLVLDTFHTTDMPITNQHTRSEFLIRKGIELPLTVCDTFNSRRYTD